VCQNRQKSDKADSQRQTHTYKHYRRLSYNTTKQLEQDSAIAEKTCSEKNFENIFIHPEYPVSTKTNKLNYTTLVQNKK